MNKEKQIEEMIEFLNNRINIERNSYFGKGCITIPLIEAERILYILGSFRKQSEGDWISVEDRLPTYKDGKVLIYTAYGISIAEITVSGRWKGANAIPKFITHWKPLPEPPKMKGE